MPCRYDKGVLMKTFRDAGAEKRTENFIRWISWPSFRALGVMSLFLTMFFWHPDKADCAEKRYYSIHLASFKYLRNANGKVNSLQKKGKIIFWKKTDVPNKGEFYRVFLGKYKNKADAVEFWRKLKKEGAVSYFGIYEFREEMHETAHVSVPDSIPIEKPQDAGKPQTAISPPNRFIDNNDGTVTDTLTNLMWIKNGWRLEFVSAATWQEAQEKCKNFRQGGYKNWRLSTIEEWKSLIDTQKQAPALVDPSPFENIIVHLPYWSKTEFVVGADYLHNRSKSARVYTVMLYSGNVNHQLKTERAFILPVRGIE